MKTHLFLILILSATIISCMNTAAEQSEWEVFGIEFPKTDAQPISEVVDKFTMDEEKEFKIFGELTSVCQEKGCWTLLTTNDGRTVRMTFWDYSFFIPVDYAGKTVIAEGLGSKKTTTVEELRHYAKDAGKSEDEILAITEPKTEYYFEARGLLVKKDEIAE